MKRIFSIVAMLCITLSLCACGKISTLSGFVETRRVVQQAVFTVEGDAVFPDHEGNIQKITADAYEAARTKDGKYVYLLEKDGMLSCVSADNKSQLAGGNKPVRDVVQNANDGVIYYYLENQGRYYKPDDNSYENYWDNIYVYEMYRFNVGTVKLGEIISYKTATETTAILYTVKDEESGKTMLYLVKPDDAEPVFVASSQESKIRPIGVSDDGSVYVWAEDDSVYLYTGEERLKVLSDCINASRFYAYFNETNDFVVIECDNSDAIAFWSKEEGLVKAKVPNTKTGNVYTDLGIFASNRNVTPDALYVTTKDGTLSMYSVSKDGNRERIASNIDELAFKHNSIYYTNVDGQLTKLKVKSGVVEAEERIADGVNAFSVSPDGKSVMYIRDVASDMVGAIYYYSDTLEKPVRVTSEGFCETYTSSYSGETDYFFRAKFSNDGKFIYYFVDGNQISGTRYYSATLMQYNMATQESKRIGTEIMINFSNDLSSGYYGGYPDPHGLWYQQYASIDEEKGIITDLLFWDGEKSTVMATDIDY